MVVNTMGDSVPSTENNREPKQHRTRADSTSSYVVLRETAKLKRGINSSKNNAKETKQPRKRGRKQEKLKRDNGQVESRSNKCCQGLCFHRLLQFLVLFFSVAALTLVILMVLGVWGPDRCSCNRKGELTLTWR